MKFGWKIFLLCIAIYVFSFTITGTVIIENTYNSLLSKEVERGLDEESKLHTTLALYLLNNKRISGEKIKLVNYSQSIVDMFNNENSYLEVFDERMNLLASNMTKRFFPPREELKVALEGKKNFILRRDNEKHFLFITNVLQIDDERIILSFINDITHVDLHRKEQYLFFMKIGFAGLILVAIITWIMSKVVMKPIKNLSTAAQNIASGNYNDRVKVTSRDEVGLLAEQFNKMAEEIEQKINQLEKESHRQQRFIDNLTHELRTPLTSIIGYAELLQRVEYEPQLFRKSLNYIYSEGNRMLKLANTLMDMIMLREKAYQLQKHSVLPLLTEVKDIMDVKAKKKEIFLRIAGIEGQDLKLEYDWDLMKGVLLNLLDNAIKASERGQSITLGVEKTVDLTKIYVQDNGKGMSKEEVKKVKEPFYRIDKSRSRNEGGIGLGLALCNEIITGHGAQMKITSEPGKGTQVDIIFKY